MMTKIVIWGTNAKEEKSLLTLELKPEDNKVEIWSIPEKDVTDKLENDLIEIWKKNKEVALPESATLMERPLSISESILPEDIKVSKGAELLQRAQTEWHFVVLSNKLHDLYENELGDIKTKVDSLSAFSMDVFNELKGFWNKVQSQIRDRNLMHNHSDKLRNSTNNLFTTLKEMRASFDKEFRESSAGIKKVFFEKLDVVENKIEKGRLSPLFEELKTIQKDFKDTKLTKEDRSQIWNRLDKAFKVVKEKKFGANANKGSGATERLQKRYDGLMNALEKMTKSIDRDKRDLNYQNNRINNTDGQLEAQLREAKLAMVKERIRSKEEKLADMNKTKAELEAKIASQKAKDAKKEAEVEIKNKIAKDIEAAKANREQDSDKLTALGAALTASKPKPKTEAVKPKPVPVQDDSFSAAISTAIAVDSIEVHKIGNAEQE